MGKLHGMSLAAIALALIIKSATQQTVPVGSTDSKQTLKSQPQDPPRAEYPEPLTTAILARRADDVFPAGYFATISVIQGVALGALVLRAVPEVAKAGSWDKWTIIAKATIMFLGIVTVSHQYFWFTTLLRWPATLRDTIVPFALGVTEIVPTLVLDSGDRWWATFFVFALFGTAAQFNSVTRLDIDSFGGDDYRIKLVWRLLIR